MISAATRDIFMELFCSLDASFNEFVSLKQYYYFNSYSVTICIHYLPSSHSTQGASAIHSAQQQWQWQRKSRQRFCRAPIKGNNDTVQHGRSVDSCKVAASKRENQQ
jgi:hypothetical protein